ncbi:MAG TPA: OmpP1/FadL family transporter [Myxococcaceae bacterium]|nr:OmpP1/FadL family transporter [Myxococcaceae bacterium]
MSQKTHARWAVRPLAFLRRTSLPALLLLGGTAQAAGFAIDTQGARATAMGTAVAAHVDDPSAIYYNPAGLVGAEGLQFQLGVTPILPSITFSPSGAGEDTSTDFSISPPPHFYASYRLLDRVALGVSLTTPFGASAKWPEGWAGAELTRGASLAMYEASVAGSVQLHERLRLGASLRAIRGTVEIRRELNFIDSRGDVELGGAGWGMGFSVGGTVDIITDALTVGANYRSGAEVDFEGRAHFESPPEFDLMLRDQPISSSVDLPAFLLMGVAWTGTENLTLAFDAHYVFWSSFRELRFEFEDPSLTQAVVKNWRDAWSFHLGGEYELGNLGLRAGLVYDQTPSPAQTLTPDLPDSDRFKVALGAGYTFLDRFTADLGYQFVLLTGKESTAPHFPGKYTGTAHVFGLTLGARL